jgi:hypothetical protein
MSVPTEMVFKGLAEPAEAGPIETNEYAVEPSAF